MTDKLKCPFCGGELEKEEETRKWFYCVNDGCPHKYTSIHETILCELIGAKKAQDLLKEIKDEYDFQEIKAREGQDIDWRVLANIFADKITSITTQKII